MARSNFQDVAFEERHTMLGLLLSIIAIGVYTLIVCVRAFTDEQPFTDVAWQGPLLLCVAVGGGLYALSYAVMRVGGRKQRLTDERDEYIRAAGEGAGGPITSLAVLIVLVMLALDVDAFWVAHTLLYATFFASVVQAATVMSAYRQGLS